MRSLSRLSLLAVLGVLLALCLWGARVLPERVAAHFDFAGDPDGWVSRTQFTVIFGVLIAVIALLGFGLPALARSAPLALVNLPNRRYWLAPERRERTLAYLADQLRWIAAWTGGLMAVLFWSTIDFNRGFDPESAGALAVTPWALGVFLAGTVLWTLRLLLRFRRPRRSERARQGGG